MWQWGQVTWGMQGASGIVWAPLGALILLVAALQALRALVGKPRAHQLPPQKVPLGKEKPVQILCVLWKNKSYSCITDVTEYSVKRRQKYQIKLLESITESTSDKATSAHQWPPG